MSIGCSAVLLEIYEKALSEHLFLPVVLAFVLVAEEVLTRPRHGIPAGAMLLLTWVAFYLRYAGVVLIAVGALVLLVATLAARALVGIARAAGFTIAGLSVPLVWMVRNLQAGSGALGPRAGASASVFTNVSRVANELSTWVGTDATPSILRRAVLVVVFGAVVAGIVALSAATAGPRA